MDLRSQNYISLAAGVGGLDLGVHMALRTARLVCAVEIEAYACEVLASRMEEGGLDPAPVWTDLRTFDGRPWRGLVDGVVAGYPCQPWSLAGKRRGVEDPRHLWPHVARVIREVGPSWVFCENVAGHLSLGAHEVTRELQDMGYDVAAGCFTAAEVGAPHKRERIFIFALSHTEQRELQRRGGSGELEEAVAHHHHHRCKGEWGGRLLDGERPAFGDDADGPSGSEAPLGNNNNKGLEGRRVRFGECANEWAPWPPGPEDTVGWREYLARWSGLEPAVHRSSDGLAARVDRIRACGNGVVPLQAAYAFVCLLQDLLAYRSARSGSGRHDVENRTTGVGVEAPELE